MSGVKQSIPAFCIAACMAICTMGCVADVHAQSFSRNRLFADTVAVTLQLSTHLRNLDDPRHRDIIRPATATLIVGDSLRLSGPAGVQPRGKLRFNYCDPPPLMVHFNMQTPSPLKKFGKLKLVWPCHGGEYYEQLVVKEYLAYRMYNLITPYSFRVKMVALELQDSTRGKQWMKRIAFLVEDIDDVAKRVGMKETQDSGFMPIDLAMQQYSLMAVFQYMIGNTDWAVSTFQNIKILEPESGKPVAVPYDFDNAGLINAEYAVPHASIPVERVTQRYNKAMPMDARTIEAAGRLFQEQKEAIFRLIDSEPLLRNGTRIEMRLFLQEFFRLLQDKTAFEAVFMRLE